MESRYYAIPYLSAELILFPDKQSARDWKDEQFPRFENAAVRKIPSEKVAERHVYKAVREANILRRQVGQWAREGLLETALRRAGDYLRARARVHDAYIEQEIARMIGHYDFQSGSYQHAHLEDTDAIRKYLFFSRKCREDASLEDRRVEILKHAAPELFK